MFDLRVRCVLQGRAHAGTTTLEGFHVSYNHLRSLYMQYRTIFWEGIYDFHSLTEQPFIIDGGSCIGMSTLRFKQLYPGASIICFEPDPDVALLLVENISRNKLDGVEVVVAGLSDKDGELSFQADDSDGGRFVEDADGQPPMRIQRLSPYLKDQVDFLKLNIEGHELPVLQEVAESGKLAQVRMMVIEYHGWAGQGQRLGEVLKLLDSEGFKYYVHDFDKTVCAVTQPPFEAAGERDWFCLIAAFRSG